VNEVICHGIPDLRPLQDGDIVNIDVSVYFEGYHADLNETYLVGTVDDTGRRLVDTTRECLEKAIQLCTFLSLLFLRLLHLLNPLPLAGKPGAHYRDLGDVIEKHAKANGFSVVKTYCGHGVHRQASLSIFFSSFFLTMDPCFSFSTVFSIALPLSLIMPVRSLFSSFQKERAENNLEFENREQGGRNHEARTLFHHRAHDQRGYVARHDLA